MKIYIIVSRSTDGSENQTNFLDLNNELYHSENLKHLCHFNVLNFASFLLPIFFLKQNPGNEKQAL